MKPGKTLGEAKVVPAVDGIILCSRPRAFCDE